MPPQKPPALIKLPPEAVTRLTEMEAEGKKVRHTLDVLKQTGIDVKVLEDKLNWIERMRKLMLTEFTK